MAVTIRRNGGSFDKVKRVYAYHPPAGHIGGRACCLLTDFNGCDYLDCLEMHELESLNDNAERTYADLDAALRMRASHILKRED